MYRSTFDASCHEIVHEILGATTVAIALSVIRNYKCSRSGDDDGCSV